MSFWSRISNAMRGERLNREIDEELQAHMDEAIEAGRDPHEARRAFGSMLRAREASHDIRAAGWLESLLADVKFGWRQLGRNKVTSAAAVLSLALGIGSCVGAFRLMDALLWRPLAVAGSSRLYVLSRKLIGPEGRPIEDNHWATRDFNLMREAVKDQADLIAVSDADRVDIARSGGSGDEMEKARVAYVSGNMFPLFGLEPALGRLFISADDRSQGSPYAVLSWDYWNRSFARDPKVLGQPIHIGDQTFEIIGVGPRDFTGTETGIVTDIFLPLGMNSLANDDSISWHRTFLMLKPGVDRTATLGEIGQHLSSVSRAFEESSKTFRGMTQAQIKRYLDQKLVVTRAGAGISELQKDYRRYLGILGLLVALVLLIACVNVANMMSAQAASRAQEMALRISIGAGRRRLLQLILTQSVLLALLASALGAGFAAWSAPFVLSLINPPDDPARLALPADWRVLLFGLALIIVVVLLVGLLPALRASGVRPIVALKGGEDPHAPRRLMRGSIALQVAFCFLVVFLASLFVETFRQLEKRPLGFSTDRVLLLETVAGKGQLPVVWNQTAEALRAVPGVDAVAISGWPLLGGIAINSNISVNGVAPGLTPGWFLNISPGWLATMKIPLVEGRDFRAEETSPGVAIVNETFAKTFFPGQDPIGRTFARAESQYLGPASQYKIVGVVPNVPYRDLREPVRAVYYIPFNGASDKGAPSPVDFATFVIHTDAQNSLALAQTLRQIVAQRHNGLRVSNATTELELVRNQTIRERLLATLAAFFAGVALLLAGIGLYGVLNYSVLQRRREIGIRIAVGSPRARIARLVTSDIAQAVLLGCAAGLLLGLFSARSAATLFYGVKATDTSMLSWPALAILLTAIAASVPPVLRALHTDPTRILRSE